MALVSTRVDHKSDPARDNLAPPPAIRQPDDLAAIEEFLHLLARAVRQFHTYPPTSPLCTDAIAACHKALAMLHHRDRLTCRVAPAALIVDEVEVGAATVVEHELVRRLRDDGVMAFDIDRIATARHLSHFCLDLARSTAATRTRTSLAESLVEHGVDTIVLRMAYRPEILNVGVPTAPLVDLVGHEQRRRQSALAAGGPVDYLYPPDKGWVRIDPSTRLDNVSLLDLAVLVDDPAEMATILLRLTDDDTPATTETKTPLERKFSDLTMLFSSLDPRLARVMFGKLARTVLELDPTRREDLLRRTILPGLLDGKADGAVLGDFPDVDLTDALCLLLELETAAPQVLNAALNRLDLPAERRNRMLPLIEERLRQGPDAQKDAEESKGREIDRLASRLVEVDSAPGKDFSEFAAFDLSIDGETAKAIVDARDAIASTDVTRAQLGLLVNLVRLEPNPGVVDAFMRRVLTLFADLDRAKHWPDLALWATRLRELAVQLRDTRPDVSELVARSLGGFYVPARLAALIDLYAGNDEKRQIANALVEAFGDALAPSLVAMFDDPAQTSKISVIVSVMCEHAGLLAPVVAAHLGKGTTQASRSIIKVLGFAGPGYEAVIAEQFARADEQTFREALRALARIGTGEAATLVARQLQAETPKRRAAAEEALWHFSADQASVQVRRLLGSREFVVQHPDAAGRLLARAAQAGTSGLDKVLEELEGLRFHFWKPGLVRVALKARELRAR
jgi:hypothetical protein